MLERDSERSLIEGSIESARAGQGRLVVVEGPAGIGKTKLLAAAAEQAGARGLAVLHARGGELERDFAYGVVRQLFEPFLSSMADDERGAVFAGAAGVAASHLGLLPPSTAVSRVDPVHPVLHGLYWLTANLAAQKSLLISVDDAHWSDAPSLRWFHYLVRRLEELPVLVLFSARPADPDAEPELLARIESDPHALVLRPAPLSEAAVAALVREALSPRAEDDFCRACHAATGGNPFLTTELLRELARMGLEPKAAGAGQVAELAPRMVTGAVRMRLGRLPEAAPPLARAVAILERTEPRHAARLAGLDESDAVEAADALRAEGLFAASWPLEFAHPLVRSSIYAAIPLGERARAHGQSARLLRAEGMPSEQVAGHLLLAEPSAEGWVVEALRDAAAVALSRGAPETAIAYLRRALAEPPDFGVRSDVLGELGSAESLAHMPDAAEHLSEALTATTNPIAAGGIALELGHALMQSNRTAQAVAVLEGAIADLGGADPELRLRLAAHVVEAGRHDLSTRRAALEQIAGWRTRLVGRTPAERLALASLAFELAVAGEPAARVVEVAERALGDRRLLADVGADYAPYYAGVHALVFADEVEAAARAFEAALEDARSRGSVVAFTSASCFRSNLHTRRGALSAAEADSRTAIEAARSHGLELLLPFALMFLLDVLLEHGDTTSAAEALARVGVGEHVPDTLEASFVLYQRGRLRLEQRDVERGIGDLLECGRRLEEWGVRNPAVTPWRSTAALALAGVGERAEAKTLIDEELALARRFGTARAIGVALRAAGLVAGRREGFALLLQAVGELERSPSALEHARALVDLGAATRRAGRRSEAKEVLSRGLELAHRCGASALAEQARQELVAAGGRPRRPFLTGIEALTPSELRVAEMAARGLGNREIAQALFVTTRTVEVHLSHVYRKLEIASRAELPPPSSFSETPTSPAPQAV